MSIWQADSTHDYTTVAWKIVWERCYAIANAQNCYNYIFETSRYFFHFIELFSLL